MEIPEQFIIERSGKRMVLYAGLLDLAHQDGLQAITTQLLQIPGDANGQSAIVQATVVTSKGTYQGIGDADPKNAGGVAKNALIRMAETRAKARALRDAVNVGVAALEESDDDDGREEAPAQRQPAKRQEPRPAAQRQGRDMVDRSAAARYTPQPPAEQWTAAEGDRLRQLTEQDDRLQVAIINSGKPEAVTLNWIATGYGSAWNDLSLERREAVLTRLEGRAAEVKQPVPA